MPRKANPTLVGRMPCPGCESRIPVYINVRGYFYTKCAECGTDQRNGKAIQTHIYLNTDWIDGPPDPPRCVDPADLVPAAPEPEETPSDPDPEPETVPTPVPKSNRKKPTFTPFALGLLVPLIIIGVLPG